MPLGLNLDDLGMWLPEIPRAVMGDGGMLLAHRSNHRGYTAAIYARLSTIQRSREILLKRALAQLDQPDAIAAAIRTIDSKAEDEIAQLMRSCKKGLGGEGAIPNMRLNNVEDLPDDKNSVRIFDDWMRHFEADLP